MPRSLPRVKLHGRNIDVDSPAYDQFMQAAYQAELTPSRMNKTARRKAFFALTRANEAIIKQQEIN